MERSSWERALARAVTDRRFRARLLADPAEMLEDYGLPAQDRPLVDALRSTPSLAQLAAAFLHLSATVWAEPANASSSYVEDPFLSPHLSFAGGVSEPWLTDALVPLDQLPGTTSKADGARAHEGVIRIELGGKDGANQTKRSTPPKRRDIRFYGGAPKPARRPPSQPDVNGEDDVVNF